MKSRPPASIAYVVAAWLAALPPAVVAGAEAQTNGPATANARSRGGPFPRQLTVFDRQGRIVGTLGEPAVYQQPMFSPDAMRLAVVKLDPQTRAQDIWVFDLSKGTGARFTFDPGLESAPVWSQDGRQIAYSAYRADYGGLYRKPSDGTGSEQLVFRAALGTTLGLTDWSPDGRFMSFTSGGALYYVPANGPGNGVGEPKPLELLRDEFSNLGARFSPDGRFLAYRSDESGRNEIYVRPFDPSAKIPSAGGKWQLSDRGGLGLIQWRQDGKELYYLAADGGVMAAAVTTAPSFTSAPTTLLFRAPDTIPLTGTPGGLAGISADGQRFVFAVPTPPQRTPIAVAADILEKYVGAYTGPGDNDVLVTREGDQLMIQPGPGQGRFLLFASSETSFYFQTVEPEIEFVKDASGDVTHFVLYQGGRATRAMRK